MKKFEEPLAIKLVSIIVPCRNASSSLSYCLNSCFQQTHNNLEILLIDNHSTDRSVAVAQSLVPQSPFPFKILHCPQRGANRARNLGFIHAQGEFIQWLDADDTLAPDKIARQVATLEANLTYDIAYSNWTWHFHHERSSSTQLHFTSQSHDDFLLQTLMDDWYPPHSYLFRRAAAETLHDLQAWNPNTPICMDREYLTIAALSGFRFLYVPQTSVTYHRWSNQQITQSTPYLTRAQTLRTLWQRFQQYAQSQPNIQPHHWQLLQQSQDLWQLPPIQVTQQENQYFLNHPTHSAPISLSYSEAMILTAMQKTSGSYRLEDHARLILRSLWKTLLRCHSLDPSALTQALSSLVGLPEIPPVAPLIATPGIPLTPHLSLSIQSDSENPLAQISPADLIDAVPVFAPVFSIHRWAILQTLERFRAQNILHLVTTPVAAQTD